uniref:Uncharacterized protein n=1 Tax=Solanum lycopersicum TaxID=4081 RepID=A0A3Q7G483_SOLLC
MWTASPQSEVVGGFIAVQLMLNLLGSSWKILLHSRKSSLIPRLHCPQASLLTLCSLRRRKLQEILLSSIVKTADLSHTPPGGVLPAHPDCDNTLQPGVQQLQHGIEEKPSYASTIMNPSSSKSNCTRHEKENIITEQSTHNSIPAVIFKPKDYYSITAEDCRYTLAGQ